LIQLTHHTGTPPVQDTLKIIEFIDQIIQI
jgi:hypothetical protein